MKRFVDVKTGEIMAGGAETVLKSNTHNACMVFVAYDADHKVGGLAHAMFLKGDLEKKWPSKALKKAEMAVDEMLEDMLLLGANKQNIEIRLVSGENVPHQKGDQEYNDNIFSAIELLKRKRLRVEAETAVDIGPNRVALDVETGSIAYV